MGEAERVAITLKAGFAGGALVGAAAARRGSARVVIVNFIVDGFGLGLILRFEGCFV